MKIKKYVLIVCSFVLGTSCVKDNFLDTGVSMGRFDGNMIKYMDAHPYDWDSTLMMIRHAGQDMVALFEGENTDYKNITFLGLTNHSIRRYLLENNKKRVLDLDPEWCSAILLKHVIDGRFCRKDIPAGVPEKYGTVGTGGIFFETLGGTKVWMYSVGNEQNGILQNAAKPIFVIFIDKNKKFAIASADIEPDNGLIHALEYKFTLGEE